MAQFKIKIVRSIIFPRNKHDSFKIFQFYGHLGTLHYMTKDI